MGLPPFTLRLFRRKNSLHFLGKSTVKRADSIDSKTTIRTNRHGCRIRNHSGSGDTPLSRVSRSTIFKVYKVDNHIDWLDIGSMTTKTLENEVVEDFANVLRRHSRQSPAVLARLASTAFLKTLGSRATRKEKLAAATMRGLEARQRIMEAEGGSLSSDEVSRQLRISKTAVLKRLDAGKLLAWREERLQAARFPAWQFNEHGEVLKGLVDALRHLNENPHLDVWAKILFFLQTKDRLGGRRPLDALREGDVDQVMLAAEAYAE